MRIHHGDAEFAEGFFKKLFLFEVLGVLSASAVQWRSPWLATRKPEVPKTLSFKGEDDEAGNSLP